MEKVFLIVLIMVGYSLGICAQQEHPTPTPVQAGEVLYLYNKNMRGFLVGGNNYNTQASLSFNHAYKIVLEKYYDEAGKWDGVTYFVTDSVEMGYFRGSYRNLFIENNGLLYVDQDRQGNTRDRDNLWTIEQIDGKTDVYRITPSSLKSNHDFCCKQLGAMLLSAQNLPVVGIYDPIGRGIDYEWCFVTEETKTRFLEKQQSKKLLTKEDIINNNANRLTGNYIPDEEIVYMLNVDYDGLLIGGNNYKTQASLSKIDAYKVILHKYIGKGEEWDGKSYLITDSVRSGHLSGTFRNMFVDPNGIIWVDQGEQNSHLDCVWEIESSKSNPSVCSIRPSNKNHIFTPENLPDYYLGAFIHSDFREMPTLGLIKGQNCQYCTWAFITDEQWEQLKMVERRDELQQFINLVKVRFPDVDITEAQRVYRDYNSSSSEIENQIGQMRTILFSNNLRNNNIDFTSLINNADFEVSGGKGWDMLYDANVGSITWYGGDSLNHCAEAYQAVFDFNQEIMGIPNGLYRVDLQAFYRTRGADLAWIERDSSFVVPEFYANSISLPINNLMHQTFSLDDINHNFLQAEMSRALYNWTDPIWQCLDGTYALHNMRAAAQAFSKGYFNQSLYCLVDKNEIKIGVREQQKKIGSWCAWDNFRMTYLTETVGNYREAVRCHLEKAIELEKLAKIKGVSAQILSEAIKNAEQMLQDSNIKMLRESLLQTNQAIKEIRNKLEEQEFGDANSSTTFIYAQVIEDDESEEEKLRRGDLKVEQDNIAHLFDEAHSYYFIGEMVLAQNEELAFEHFHKALDLFIGIPSYYFNENNKEVFANVCYYIGTNCNLKKDFQQAEQSYKKAIEIIDQLYESACASKSDYAIQVYKQFLLVSINGLSYSFAYQEKYEDAIATINRAIELQPEEANFYDSKGEILYMSGDIDGAKEMWEKVVNINPSFADTNSSQLYQLLLEK